MIFNSLTYLLLLFAVVILYWNLNYRLRLLLIFTASMIFYCFWRVEFLWVMLVSVITDYHIALRLPQSHPVRKRHLLWISLGVNLGLLFYFKYLIFFAENAVGLANILGAEIDPLAMEIILPLGISFYTFQTISYTVDVYRGKIKPESDFLLYACYVTFFPQLIAGPVLRAAEVISQFAKRPAFTWEDVTAGVRRIIYGLFLKVVLADNLAPIVDEGFKLPVETLSALDIWTLAFLFGFQIYFDFSAYSHIALGSARLMGIHFPENFNFPYLASSPRDFWKRWHISLSSWIRDYLYLPLAGIKVQDRSIGGLGNATVDKHKNAALFTTWAIMGLWHGASWTFVLWGLFHASVICCYRAIAPRTSGISKSIKLYGGIAVTLPLMMLAWIPFRATSLEHAFLMWAKVIQPNAYGFLGMKENVYLVATVMMLAVFIVYLVKETLVPLFERTKLVSIMVEATLFAVIIPLVIVFLRPINQFIYFQF